MVTFRTNMFHIERGNRDGFPRGVIRHEKDDAGAILGNAQDDLFAVRRFWASGAVKVAATAIDKAIGFINPKDATASKQQRR